MQWDYLICTNSLLLKINLEIDYDRMEWIFILVKLTKINLEKDYDEMGWIFILIKLTWRKIMIG
jgi:hypothetical protein